MAFTPLRTPHISFLTSFLSSPLSERTRQRLSEQIKEQASAAATGFSFFFSFQAHKNTRYSKQVELELRLHYNACFSHHSELIGFFFFKALIFSSVVLLLSCVLEWSGGIVILCFTHLKSVLALFSPSWPSSGTVGIDLRWSVHLSL